MLLQIDDLNLPATLSAVEELVNRDTSKRTVSGKLITKLAPNEKWKITLTYENIALSLDFQSKLFAKCLEMRRTEKPIRFISPYDNMEITIMAKCTARKVPDPLMVLHRRPGLYLGAGAVFEEV